MRNYYNLWHDVLKEAPTSLGEGVIVLCKNKNKEDGIWLSDFIPCWEGEWKPRDNWETPVKWAYIRDLYPSDNGAIRSKEQPVCEICTNYKGCVTCKDGNQWEGQPVCEDLEEEIKRCVYEPFFDLDGVAVKGATHYLTVEDVADIARHFAQWGAEHLKTEDK